MKKEKEWQEFANNLVRIKQLKDMLDNISTPKITVIYPEGTEQIYIGQPE